MKKHLFYLAIAVLCLLCGTIAPAAGEAADAHGFVRIDARWIASENAQGSLYRHEPSGLYVFHLENEATEMAFSIGFITPPLNDRGANHVLEHAVLCGSEKYPARGLMHHVRSTSVASVINAVTNDQSTAYLFRTDHAADYYNLMDVYLNAVFHPLVLREENIFLQQGFRWEVQADDRLMPNGVVYNELRQNSLESDGSMLLAVRRALNAALFAGDTPVFSSGGELDALPDLTWDEVRAVYDAAYHPGNALVFLSGQQDVQRTFALLDAIVRDIPAGNDSVQREYRLHDTEAPFALPEAGESGTLVDIGFAFSGIPTGEARSVYARDAMLMLAIEHLREAHDDVFMVADDTSGYATFAVIVAGVPLEEAEAVAQDFEATLQGMAAALETGAIADALDTYEWMVEDGNGWALFATLKGFANGGDPYALLEKQADFAYLRENPDFLRQVWQAHLMDTPHKAVVALARQPGGVDVAQPLAELQLARLRQQNEAFQVWVDAPQTEEEAASLPRLRLQDFAESPWEYPMETGDRDGIRYWFQPNAGGAVQELAVALAIPHGEEAWLDLALLARLATDTFDAADMYLIAYDDAQLPGNVLPMLCMIPTEGANADMKALADILQSPEWITAELLAAFLPDERQQVAQFLSNPYTRTVEAMVSDISPKDRFAWQTLGMLGSGSEAYLESLQQTADGALSDVAARLAGLAASLADRQGMMVYLRGERETLDPALEGLLDAFALSGTARQTSFPLSRGGVHSSLVLTQQAEATVHYLQVGLFEGTEWARSGQIDVMARVLQGGYVLPELRDKRGAYGAQVAVENSHITLGASGVGDMEEAFAVLAGAGTYLRNLDMAQETLEGIIIAAVHAFDQRNSPGSYFAMEADMNGNTVQWLEAHRAEMLQTTVADIRGFADFLDAMLAQQRVFAYTNEAGAASGIAFERVIRLGE